MGSCFSGLDPAHNTAVSMDSHAALLDVRDEPMEAFAPPVPHAGGMLGQVVMPTRIFFGIGFVIHGMGLHFSNGTRTGLVLEDIHVPVDLHDQFRMPHRATQTIHVQYGECPTEISGFTSNMAFLSYQVQFVTTKNRTLPVISGTESAQRGTPFRYAAPQGYYLKDIWWGAGRPTQVFLAAIPSLVPGHSATYTYQGWTAL